MKYPDLSWTLLATIGGYLLLIGHEKDLNNTNWWGVALIFAGFIAQVYYDIRADTSLVIGVTAYLLIFFVVFWFRIIKKVVSKRKLTDKSK